jgi:hypothetical protein
MIKQNSDSFLNINKIKSIEVTKSNIYDIKTGTYDVLFGESNLTFLDINRECVLKEKNELYFFTTINNMLYRASLNILDNGFISGEIRFYKDNVYELCSLIRWVKDKSKVEYKLLENNFKLVNEQYSILWDKTLSKSKINEENSKKDTLEKEKMEKEKNEILEKNKMEKKKIQKKIYYFYKKLLKN